MYQRSQRNSILKALKVRRVLLLSGARQCGKSTLAQSLPLENIEYRTLDDTTLRKFAISDPDGFVQHNQSTLIIDEIQRAPNLLTSIKMQVDKDNRPGQFLLTGSTNLHSLPGMTESLAGRIHKVRLRPLTESEIIGTSSNFFQNAFHEDFKYTPISSRGNIIEMALRGGYPEPLLLSQHEKISWHNDYIEALLERDLRDISNISRHHVMKELIVLMAAWSGKFMDISAIGSHLAISRPTLEAYMNAFEALYLLERVPPWIKTDYDRVGKHSKVYMTDGGLMGAMLSWSIDKIINDPDKCGKLVETFVFNELSSLIDLYGSEYKLYHYRDHHKREIDFIIERNDGALLCIEIKSGATADSSAFKHIKWFQENIAHNRPCIGIVLYSGKYLIPHGPHNWSVPLSTLWT